MPHKIGNLRDVWFDVHMERDYNPDVMTSWEKISNCKLILKKNCIIIGLIKTNKSHNRGNTYKGSDLAADIMSSLLVGM